MEVNHMAPVSYLIFFSLKLLEEEEIEVPVSKESAGENTKMETDEAAADTATPPSANDNDVNMQDANVNANPSADVTGAENGTPEAGDKPVQMDTDTKVMVKRKFKHMIEMCFV